MQFQLVSNFKPKGDQPQAIAKLVKNTEAGEKHQVLLGVTGSGKTFTMSNVIAKTQRPTLVISPNKTLAAQLYQEFKEFFPRNAVHYFVSYYDYYQPEAYIPQTDTYIEKDAKVNETLDRMRHEAAQDVLSRKDCIVVASVSCIYNIGSPEEYQKVSLEIKQGQEMARRDFLSLITSLQYQRNDIDFKPGTFRVRGNVVEIFLVTGKELAKIEFKGDTIESISLSKDSLDPTYQPLHTKYVIYPAKFWVTPQKKLLIAMENIRLELQERLGVLKKQKKLLEAQRLERRTNFDLEMMAESGYCHGIENYSRHLEFRKAGDPPFTLIDYFPENRLVFVDESHQTISQLGAMSIQDKARKRVLMDHGFRLPSAVDNRPLTYEEFEERTPQKIYVSATPGFEEKQKAGKQNIVTQLIRPTGLLEPSIEIRPTKNQVKDLIKEIHRRIEKKQRVLALTLTKRLAEELSDFLLKEGISSQWLHSEVKTLERPEILKGLREGKYDVLVGINLLREGLDLPEVALVAILDADKEGFLRSETTFVQIMGRASRHPEGHVILYGDTITGSMRAAMAEVEKRRRVQENFNTLHRITPQAIIKPIRAWAFGEKEKEIGAEFSQIQDRKLLEQEMKQAAANLDFERAAELRDLILRLRSGSNPEPRRRA
ncbi:MAG: excinuclease ABC subunit B [Candidatus Wildermuthbacteria bacterium RIFCSPLOWO2_01_FULL_47_18]|uniref:UvrABC system protein B n=2 Tax=Candidatus Wildermuthiibacteriota TaxID=1817923 RepID=A0A1G2RGL1_9BACT|nr:MAG: excinuclease ABC subunit B [Candidatus Wildermuthbacteria bacterium RIFCSPHIGHO2_02_FULL_48_16]OHA71970.1 MAG: excinuclease ABC subunit B [Candidatus Wildermuthbacteria bacterium RIFCSPLOWO2_01_FULL_47_18]